MQLLMQLIDQSGQIGFVKPGRFTLHCQAPESVIASIQHATHQTQRQGTVVRALLGFGVCGNAAQRLAFGQLALKILHLCLAVGQGLGKRLDFLRQVVCKKTSVRVTGTDGRAGLFT